MNFSTTRAARNSLCLLPFSLAALSFAAIALASLTPALLAAPAQPATPAAPALVAAPASAQPALVATAATAPAAPSPAATAPAAQPATAPARFELGANFNEHLDAARLPALDITGVTWLRGFLPASEFIDGPRRLATDPGLDAFRKAAASGRKIALSLKWDFSRAGARVPAPGSAREKACFDWAVEAAKSARPDMLLLVNEVFVDTPADDMKPAPDGSIPMVVFLQRLAARVHAAGLAAPGGGPLAVACGGFTRLDQKAKREHPATLALLAWLANAPEITHVDFHMHQNTLDEFAAALAFMRKALPGRPLVVSEFSIVHAYTRHVGDKIGSTPAGRAFAQKYNLDPKQTYADYLNAIARKPVPEEQLHAMFASAAWFDPRFLEKSCALMEKNGVVLATYAYVQESSGLRSATRPMQVPWRLNPIFHERDAYVPDSPRPATTPGLYETFLHYQRQRP